MKYLLLIFLFFAFSTKSVFAAGNNFFGVHILFTDEVKLASELVNSGGGDWGYVVVPIQSTDRNPQKWQKFMDDARTSHVIPILRLSTYPQGSNWSIPNEFDSVDFANFLASLNWPTKKKIIIVYNEPNHAAEWGGEVNPWEYSDVLTDTIQQFKKRDKNFVMLNAGLDASSSNSGDAMDEYEFMTEMMSSQPDIFRAIDAFNSHSYPNPGFSSSPRDGSRYGISSYNNEISFLQTYFGIYGLKVYITETGWKKSAYLTEEKIADYYKEAYTNVWTEDYIMNVSPFILQADAGDFVNFALISNNQKTKRYDAIFQMKKIKGEPELTDITNSQNNNKSAPGVEYNQEKQENPITKYKNFIKKTINWIFK